MLRVKPQSFYIDMLFLINNEEWSYRCRIKNKNTVILETIKEKLDVCFR